MEYKRIKIQIKPYYRRAGLFRKKVKGYIKEINIPIKKELSKMDKFRNKLFQRNE